MAKARSPIHTRKGASTSWLLLAFAVATGGVIPPHAHDHAGEMRLAAADAGVVYTCPMHPEVRSNAPGRCPKCGMTLVPVKP